MDETRHSAFASPQCQRAFWLGLALGIAVSVGLHFYLIRTYVDPTAVQRAGESSNAVLVSLAWRIGCLFAVGLLVPLVVRRTPWCAGLAFAAGVGLTHAVLALLPRPSNLWPVAVILSVLVSAVPAMLGASVTGLFLARRQRASRG